jgi:6-phosphogluconolactonase
VLRTRLKRMRGLVVGAGLSMMLALTGCGAFFQCEGKTSCGSSGGGSGAGSGNFLYAANASSGPNALNVYDVSQGALTLISGSPFPLNETPVALAITPHNNFLYVASTGTTTGIYVYSLASTGVPSNANGGNIIPTQGAIASMDISPDGNWLYTIELQAGPIWVIQQYQIDTSSGTLNASQAFSLPLSASCAPLGVSPSTPYTQICMVKVAPNGNFVIASTNSTGDFIYPYANGTGSNAGIQSDTPTATNATGEFSVAVDSNNYAYFSQTESNGGSFVSVYAIPSNGVVSDGQGPVAAATQLASGATPRSITVDKTGGFVYTANQGTSTISAFSVSSGLLTQLGSSDTPGPPAVSAIGIDNTGKYLAASGYDPSKGLQLFSISSTGMLANLNQVAATGVSDQYPALLVFTH